MLQAKNLPLTALGQTFNLSYTLLRDIDGSTLEYRSPDICIDKLLLPSGQTVAAFKVLAKAEFDSQTEPVRYKLVEVQNRLSRDQFNKPLPAIVEQQKESLRLRYNGAHASDDIVFRVTELHSCARVGHVQANLDLGILFDEKRQLDCIDYFVEAHNLGHPLGLLYLSKTLFRASEHGAAVRVLLLGASCGSVQCAAVLLQLLKGRSFVFGTAAGLAALEAALDDDTPHAKYILGFVLMHSATCPDKQRGRGLMEAAAATRYRRGDNGRGIPLTPGGNQYRAGTLAHFEVLIDRELLAIRTEEMKPEFLAAVRKISFDGKDRVEELQAALATFNPVPQRMFRHVEQWLANGSTEPVDPVKLERMKALYLPDDENSGDGGDE
jgi:hypothetical protein